ncbi:MAG: hypothetical protein ACTSWR_07085 [Candidatus Helarchaeota archaeon]
MGLISRLKEFFTGKPIETFQELEKDMNKLYKKCNCSLIAFVGVASKIKGLPLIYSADNENNVRLFSAKLPLIINPLKNFQETKPIDSIKINYNNEFIYLKPILDNIAFIAMYNQKSDFLTINQWLDNNFSILLNLFKK